jgi:RNA 3'-terminal phosphate cyclase (ATP)
VDGSLLEGGGQVLRNTMAYAALLGRAIRVSRIRAGRPRPGLAAQHLAGLELVRDIVGGSLARAAIDATDISFEPARALPLPPQPQPPRKDGGGDATREYAAEVATAGSVCLLVQIALPVLLFLPAPSRTALRGGTDVIKAPTADYASEVFIPALQRACGARFAVELRVTRRGFFPRGGGAAELRVTPLPRGEPLPAFEWTQRGALQRVVGVALVGALPAAVGYRGAEAARKALREGLTRLRLADAEVAIEVRQPPREEAPHPGFSLLLIAEFAGGARLGASAVGEKGEPAERVGARCAEELLEDVEAGGCADRHLTDQLLVFMALARGRSRLRTGPLTLHAETAVHWARELCGARVAVTREGAGAVIEVEGVGYTARW